MIEIEKIINTIDPKNSFFIISIFLLFWFFGYTPFIWLLVSLKTDF